QARGANHMRGSGHEDLVSRCAAGGHLDRLDRIVERLAPVEGEVRRVGDDRPEPREDATLWVTRVVVRPGPIGERLDGAGRGDTVERLFRVLLDDAAVRHDD